jgi:hypothetical protein
MTDILAPAPAAPVLNLPPIAPAPAAPPEPGLGAEIKTDWSYHRDAHKAKTRAERRAALRKAREAVERRAETKRERLAKEERERAYGSELDRGRAIREVVTKARAAVDPLPTEKDFSGAEFKAAAASSDSATGAR